MTPDYYRVLGVDPDATGEEIRLAYRRSARAHHPDHHPGLKEADPAAMARLNEAWAVLGDGRRRRDYDRTRISPEPDAVQEAVLGAARALVSGRRFGEAEAVDLRDMALSAGPHRLAVRFLRVLDARELEAWLTGPDFAAGPDRVDCRVALACRVLVPEEARQRLRRIPRSAVAIDLIESRLFGTFPSPLAEARFRPFLLGGGD